MVTADGAVKVLDFGIARGPSATAASRGTVAYVAPEVLRGETADARADVYSLGMVLRELARDLDDRALADVLARATASDPRAAVRLGRGLRPSARRARGRERVRRPGRRPPTCERAIAPSRIVRVATRPLATAVPVHGAAQVHAALPPARGIAVARRSRRPDIGLPRVRIARIAVAAAAALVALGVAVVLGQAVASMSSRERPRRSPVPSRCRHPRGSSRPLPATASSRPASTSPGRAARRRRDTRSGGEAAPTAGCSWRVWAACAFLDLPRCRPRGRQPPTPTGFGPSTDPG